MNYDFDFIPLKEEESADPCLIKNKENNSLKNLIPLKNIKYFPLTTYC